ncbi:glycosyltransferase [Methanocella sp. MCL-LM]|uniref:glycosyltransferase n=1 Tax=Methanocella sp. MCL-LM TaxID=3412035 RepID=UPI003C70C338
MSGKKVCVVGPSKKFLSGISYYTIRLSNALAARYGVSVVCFRNLLPKFLFPGHKHVGQDLSNLSFEKNVAVFDGMDWNNPLTWYRAYKFLMKEKPDAILLQWWTSSAAHMHLIICLINLRLRAKIILEFHEVVDPFEESILPIRMYSRVMGRLLIRRANGFVTHSDSDKKLLAEKYRMSAEQIQVIPHGLYDQYKAVDRAAARNSLGLGSDTVIMSFGLIRPYKGIPNLIRAFNELPADIADRSKLLLVGEIWEDRESVVQAMDECQYKDRIMLLDRYVSDDEVAQYFSAADIVVLPYLRASQSGVAHIAMTFGKPIIVSKVGGLQESLADYAGTYFIEPGDISAIKAAIIRVLEDKPGPFEPPKRGWEEIVEKYATLIE